MPSCAMQCQSNHPTLGGLDVTWCNPFPTHSHAASSTFVKENPPVRRLLAGKRAFCEAPAPPKDFGSCRFVKEIQPSKACRPIFLTVSGIVKLVKELQPSKACSPISVTELGMSNLVKELQPAKAYFPIDVTLAGIVKLLKALHSPKAQSFMHVTDSGTVKLVKELQPKKAPPNFSHTVWYVQTGQRAATHEWGLPVTEGGMASFVKDLQSSKAEGPSRVTESAISTSNRAWQPVKPQGGISLSG